MDPAPPAPFRRLLVAALGLGCCCQCTTNNEVLEDRLERREQRWDGSLERMEMRSDSRSRRWQKMGEWEDERQRRNWDRMMY